MRILHTADWHLGRLFNGIHLTEDQRFVLDQVVDLARTLKPDAVVVAGDIYDRAVPPPEAVSLLDSTLAKIAVELRIPVLLIAGNHDSPDRLGFGAKLMVAQNVHVFGRLTAELAPVILNDQYGPVAFIGVPYAEPAVVRELLGAPGIEDHEAAMGAIAVKALAAVPAGYRSVLIAHAFVSGGSISDSERPLSMGGSGAVTAGCFHGFNYTALGHLHRPQSMGAERLHYSGSLLKYSFSESDHVKSVTMVELDPDGDIRLTQHPLHARRDVRIIEGTLAEVVDEGRRDEHSDDYVLVRLTDRGALVDPLGVVRTVYPNCLELDRSAFFAPQVFGPGAAPLDHRTRTTVELFSSFLQDVTGDPITDEELRAFESIVDALEQRERES